MKKLKNCTTGSPILDSIIASVLILILAIPINNLLKAGFKFSLLQILFIPVSVPFGVLSIIVTISVISIKRYMGGPNLKKLLVCRRYRLIFNAMNNRNKEIEFGSNGQITKGRNNNEFSWRISWGKLEILANDAKLYSRFRYDKETDKFYLIDGPHNRSLPNQVIEPIIESVFNGAEGNRKS